MPPRKTLKRNNTSMAQSPEVQNKIDDITNAVMQQIAATQKASAEELASQVSEIVKSEIAKHLEEIKEEFTEKISKTWTATKYVSQDVGKLTDNAASTFAELNKITSRLNAIEQEKFNNSLDISGIPVDDVDSRSSPNDAAAKILSSYKIAKFSSAHWRRVTTRSNERKCFLVVSFSSYTDKMIAMKRKREADHGKNCTIFFNHSLTTSNRILFMQARKVSKSLNLKVTVSHGRIFMKNSGEERGLQIKSAVDLSRIQRNKGLTEEASQPESHLDNA